MCVQHIFPGWSRTVTIFHQKNYYTRRFIRRNIPPGGIIHEKKYFTRKDIPPDGICNLQGGTFHQEECVLTSRNIPLGNILHKWIFLSGKGPRWSAPRVRFFHRRNKREHACGQYGVLNLLLHLFVLHALY
jgi:hypothetical protein